MKDSYSRYLERHKTKKPNKPYEPGETVKNLVRALTALAIAFFLEITVFQYGIYGTLRTDDPVDIFTTDDVHGEGLKNISENPEHPVFVPVNAGVDIQEQIPYEVSLTFENLNRRVSSVHIEPVFAKESYGKTMSCRVVYTDEEGTDKSTVTRVIVKGLKYSEYIPVYATGKVSRLTVFFDYSYGSFTNVAVNEAIPLTPVALRVFTVAAIIFIIGTLRRYDVFALRFDASCRKQNAIFAAVLAAFTAYCGFLADVGDYEDIQETHEFGSKNYAFENQYNYLTDAFAAGRLDIDAGIDASKLAENERVFDEQYRIQNKLEYPHDTVMYNNKFYVYFGAVPVVLFYLPYNLITGNHLPDKFATFFFCSVSLIFLSLSWRELVKKFFHGISYMTFLLGSFALSFCSFAPFLAVRSAQYEVATLSGLAFTALGVFLLFKFAFSEKKRLVTLVFSCLCLALAFGCRPTMLLWSVFVPILVWGEVKDKSKRLKTIIAVAAPYIAVAIPIMLYNYARFGNFAEFGNKYMLTSVNLQVRTTNMTLTDLIYVWIGGSVEGFYFKLPRISSTFPFVESMLISTATNQSVPNQLISSFDSGVIGILTIPVIWFLIKLRSVSGIIREKDTRLTRTFIAGMCVFAFISFASPLFGGVVIRYSVDFFWFAVLSSLVVIAALLYKHADSERRGDLEKLSGAALFASGLLGFCSTFLGECTRIITASPEVYYYLKRAFTFFAGE